ncbi:MAG: peptidase S41, partial [Prevotella sp.]
MNKKINFTLLLLMVLALSSCVMESEFSDNPQGNFEALWKIMDEHYCFFDEKGVDWNEVH